MSISRGDTRSFFKDLTPLLTGHLVLPEDAGYDQVRQHWNGRIDKHPAALVRCADARLMSTFGGKLCNKQDGSKLVWLCKQIEKIGFLPIGSSITKIGHEP